MVLPETIEDESTLYALASEYLEAANVLYNNPPGRVGYTLVIYYLAGHAAELSIKSLLCRQGATIRELAVKHGHDLIILVQSARDSGLPLRISTEHIQYLSTTYVKKYTEYRRKQYLEYPPLDLLLKEIASLHSYVFDRVTEDVATLQQCAL